MRKTLLIVDVSPLWELQFTGISNVVYELTRRLMAGDERFEIHFSVFQRIVDTDVINVCMRARSGQLLRDLFQHPEALTLARDFARERGGPCAGLYLHVKPETRSFDFEAQLYYDFSFLSVPECHHPDTIAYHVKGLNEQVLSNDAIFTISESTAKDLAFYFDYPRDRVEVALLGYHVDTEMGWRFAQRYAGRDIEPYFICIGTIEPRKNLRLIFAWLRRNGWFLQEHRFLFVGRDAWGETFEELIAEANLSDAVAAGRIVKVGYVNEAQKTALLVGASGLVFASLFEGFGLPVLEAMGLGVPIAASCTTSVPEVLGPDGIYFDPYSIESFGEAMHVLLAERGTAVAERRRMALLKRSRTFSYDHCFAVIMDRIATEMTAQAEQPLKKGPPKTSAKARSSRSGQVGVE